MATNTNEPLATTFSVRTHHAEFIPPGLIKVEWNGPCSRDDFAQVIAWADNRVPRKPYVLLANLSRLGTVTPEARRLAVTDSRFDHIEHIAFVGATFHQRVVATMISRAVDLFSKDRRPQLHFYDSETEAIDWLRQQYARIHNTESNR